jgi:hypothetical protein
MSGLHGLLYITLFLLPTYHSLIHSLHKDCLHATIDEAQCWESLRSTVALKKTERRVKFILQHIALLCTPLHCEIQERRALCWLMLMWLGAGPGGQQMTLSVCVGGWAARQLQELYQGHRVERKP